MLVRPRTSRSQTWSKPRHPLLWRHGDSKTNTTYLQPAKVGTRWLSILPRPLHTPVVLSPSPAAPPSLTLQLCTDLKEAKAAHWKNLCGLDSLSGVAKHTRHVLYLLRLHKVSGDSSSVHIASLETEARQSQKQTQPPLEPGQKIAAAHIREKPCWNKRQS